MILQKRRFSIFVVFFLFVFLCWSSCILSRISRSVVTLHAHFLIIFPRSAAQILTLILQEGEHLIYLIYYALRVTKNALFTYSQLI